MALNALRTEMVTFTGTPGFEANGVTVGYRAEYTQRTGTEAKYNAIEGRTSDVASDANHKGQYYIQLGEQLYDGKLRLNNNATDVFGRPARYWEFNGKEIGAYMKKELVRAEYTKKVTGDTLYDLLTRNTVINYDVDVFIDGEITAPTGATSSWWFTKNAINRNNDAAVGGTGNGVLTQVFVDDDDKVVTIAIINTYLAIASDDYNAKKEEASLNVYGIGKTGTGNIYYKQVRDADDDGKLMTAHVEDFNVADIKKDDAVLVTVADSEIQTLVPADIIADTEIQSFETGSNSNDNGLNYDPDKPGNVVVDGTQYDFATTAEYDYDVMQYYTTVNGTVNLKDKTYNVYLDKYGYAVGVKELEGAKNYVFITGIDTNDSNRYTRAADATAIFLDGTMDDIKIDMAKSTWQSIDYSETDSVLNTWCTYTVNTNGVYTVKEVSNVTADGNTYVPGGTNNDGKLAQFQATLDDTNAGAPTTRDGNVIKIDQKNITVPGDNGGTTSYKRVYGNDKSVYLTVELKELRSNGVVFGIIGDVVSANTGIDNVALEVWNTSDVLINGEDKTVDSDDSGDKTNDLLTTAGTSLADIDRVSNGVYTLYNEKGDVIAAVVVGEDAGATKNLVYTHTGATFREAYDKATGKWTWQRKVVFNGEEIILTEVGDGLSELGRMKKSTWYQVKYNGDGNVIDVAEYNASSLTAGEDYVTSYSHDEILNAVNKKDTVLFHSVNEPVRTADLKLLEKTLWLDGAATKGFRVDDNVKVVLIQNNHNVENTYFESGISSLRSIISDLNDRHTSKAHNYIISAILERNKATSIVIRDIDDTTGVNCDPYTDPNWGTNTTMTVSVSGGAVTCTVPVGGTVPTPRELRDAVLKHLGEVWNPDRGDEFSETATNVYSLKVNGMVYTVNLVRLLADTANVTFAMTTPTPDASNTITVDQAAKTVAVSVANNTASVVIAGTKTAAQTVAIGGTSVADVTAAGTDTAPTYTVNTGEVATGGGSKTFTLTIAEANKNPITYTVTVTVAGPGPAAPSITDNTNAADKTVSDTVADLATKTLTVSATASDSSTLAYAWKLDGTAVAGATGNSITLANTGIAQPGTYVVACDVTTNTISTPVTVTFNVTVAPVAPVITDDGSAANSTAQTVTITTSGTDFVAGTYKLYINGNTTAIGTYTLAADGKTLSFTGVSGLGTSSTDFKITVTVNGIESEASSVLAITPS